MDELSAIAVTFEDIDRYIGRWRHRLVEAAQYDVPPHITLLYPWVAPPVAEDSMMRMKAVLATSEPFDVSFLTLARFGDEVLYLVPEDNGQLDRLARELAEAFPETPPYGNTSLEPIPHLTVASGSGLDLDSLQTELESELKSELPLKYRVEQVSVLFCSTNGYWRTVSLHQLGA